MTQQRQQHTARSLPYVDLPEISETYIDSVREISSDGQMVKITLVVTRMENVQAETAPTNKQYTACRLVMPIAGAAALSDQLNKLGASLAQARTKARSDTTEAK
jgi:hypothetical protein